MTDTLGRRVVERRRWSLAEKQAIVAECQVAGASVSAVARRHGVATSQLFAWRRHYGDAPAMDVRCKTVSKRAPWQDFAAVMVLPETDKFDPVVKVGGGEPRLEIVLCNGSQLIASGGVPSATLVDAIKAMLSA
jgi:transposase-like protein